MPKLKKSQYRLALKVLKRSRSILRKSKWVPRIPNTHEGETCAVIAITDAEDKVFDIDWTLPVPSWDDQTVDTIQIVKSANGIRSDLADWNDRQKSKKAIDDALVTAIKYVEARI